MIVKFQPTHDECCSCVDDHVSFGKTRYCEQCKNEHCGLLVGLVTKWWRTYAVVQHGTKLEEHPIESIEIIQP